MHKTLDAIYVHLNKSVFYYLNLKNYSSTLLLILASQTSTFPEKIQGSTLSVHLDKVIFPTSCLFSSPLNFFSAMPRSNYAVYHDHKDLMYTLNRHCL